MSEQAAHSAIPYGKLSHEELANPYLVIEDLFDFAHLPDVHTQMWEWLKSTALGSYPKTLSLQERAIIFTLYEKLDKLLDAAHCLNEAKKREVLKKITYKKLKKNRRPA